MKQKTETTVMVCVILAFVASMAGLGYIAVTSPKLTLDKDSWVCTDHRYNLVTKSTVCTQYNRK